MKSTVKLHGKIIRVHTSPSADEALSSRKTPLLAEMELYFSCLIRKAVRFYESNHDTDTMVSDTLSIRFRPVMTKRCEVPNDGSAPPLTEFPIKRGERYVPNWLKIDYKNGQWLGEFGYAE